MLDTTCDFDPTAPCVTIKDDKDALTITVTISPTDGALVVEIDTNFEPNLKPLRVWVNDYEMS